MFLWIARPAHAVALVATTLIVGAGFGSLPATDKTLSAQRTAYAASINPVTAAHDSTATHP